MIATRTLTLITALAFVAAACGSDESGDGPAADGSQVENDGTIDQPDDSPSADVDLEAIRAELDAIEYDSPAVDGGGVLGNEPLADTDAAGPQDLAETTAEPCLDDGTCEDFDELPPPTTAPPFVPNATWAPFCTVLAEIEQRPFPTDDAEALRVIDIWFGLLEPYVPDQIAADFAVLDAVVDDAVASQDVGVIEQAPDGVDEASSRIGDAVDAGCSGRGDVDG